MRTEFKNIELPKKLAKAIVHVFPALKLSTGQEWAARICGYRNWHELDFRTRNFAGEPTTDPFFSEYVALDQGFGKDHDSPSVRAKRERIDYQYNVLDELTRSCGAVFTNGWSPYWEIMHYAHEGVPRERMHFGSGTPLFRALQFPWFDLEDRASCIFEEGDLTVDGWKEAVCLLNGFSSYSQLNKWLRGASGLSHAALSEMKSEFPGIAPRIGGGSVIRLASDEHGSSVIVQSVRHRYWWQQSSNRKMIGGFSLTMRVSGRQDDPVDDEFQLCIHDAWDACGIDFDTTAVPFSNTTEDVCRFLQTRLGMDVMVGTVSFACDDRPGSKVIAENLRDLVCDFSRDATDMDLDNILQPEVVRYRPKYPLQMFSLLASDLV